MMDCIESFFKIKEDEKVKDAHSVTSAKAKQAAGIMRIWTDMLWKAFSEDKSFRMELIYDAEAQTVKTAIIGQKEAGQNTMQGD